MSRGANKMSLQHGKKILSKIKVYQKMYNERLESNSLLKCSNYLPLPKCGSRGIAHVDISLRWSVQLLLIWVYEDNQSLIVLLIYV